MKPVTTRTIGPLHLEDLEPHRFEDLIRQLLYDFRDWNQLEATGRTGSDDGFDVRGIEGRKAVEVTDDEQLEELSESGDFGRETRQWLIQCKREKSIGPKKLVGYVDDIPDEEVSNLYGIVFVAACDFSKKARDDFRARCREIGISEAHIWGKAEVEDQLFQAKNDNLLFAYFGISLTSRKRTLRSNVRSRLSAQRKVRKKLSRYEPFIILDASDDRFPFLEDDAALPRYQRGRWTVAKASSFHHLGIEILVGRGVAIYREDGTWDYAETMNDAKERNPWFPSNRHSEHRARAMEIWDAAPESERGWYEVVSLLPYDWIVEIDDEANFERHLKIVYVDTFDTQIGPIDGCYWRKPSFVDHWRQEPEADPEKRVEIFERSDNREKSV